MTTLHEAAQQALEALEEIADEVFSPYDNKLGDAILALRAALAQQDEPVARECSDPMCACRGGPCAECEEGEREKEIEDLRFRLDFYQRRCEALQSWQSKMRDPERTIVCDILANGFTLDPAFAGDRYTAPPQQAEPVQEPVAWLIDYEDGEREVRFVAGTRGITQTPLYAAAPTAKPVAWMTDRKEMYFDKDDALRYSDSITQPLYLAPPQRKPLTKEQFLYIYNQLPNWGMDMDSLPQGLEKFGRAIEQAHGIKK